MRNILFAAALLAGCGAALTAGAAPADEFDGTLPPASAYFHSGRNAPPVFDPAPAAAVAAPIATGGAFDQSDAALRSHGHP